MRLLKKAQQFLYMVPSVCGIESILARLLPQTRHDIKRLWVLFVFFLAIPSIGNCLTRSEIRTQVRLNIRDNLNVSYRYQDSELNGFIDQAELDVVNATWCLQNTQTYVLTANTTFYDLPDAFLSARQVTFRDSANRSRDLEEKSERAIYQQNPDWLRQAGAPVNYMIQYSTGGGTNLQISYIPIPTTSSTGTVYIDYYSQVTAMDSDSDTPFNSVKHLQPYVHTIIDLVTYRIMVIEGMPEAAAYLQNFNGRMQIMSNQFQRRENYFPSFSAVGVGTK